MTPEKAAKQASRLLILGFKDVSPYDPKVQGHEPCSFYRATSDRKYALTGNGLEAIQKATRKLVPVLDGYPVAKCNDRLTRLVVEMKDGGTAIADASERLREGVLEFLSTLSASGEWETIYAVRGIDLSEGPFSVGACQFYLMDDPNFVLWGRRYTTGQYNPSPDAPICRTWFEHQRSLLGQIVAAARVQTGDRQHAQSKGLRRTREAIDLLRYGQLVVGVPARPFPEIGQSSFQWEHDHNVVIRLDQPDLQTSQSLAGPIGNRFSLTRRAPGWEELDRLVASDSSRRNEIQLRLTTALEWMGQAAQAPSSAIRLVAVVTALEALLIEDGESVGKKKKLANRVSRLITQDPAKQQVVANDVERVYKSRSECVHGGLIDVEPTEVEKAIRLTAEAVAAVVQQEPYRTMCSLKEILRQIEPTQ